MLGTSWEEKTMRDQSATATCSQDWTMLFAPCGKCNEEEEMTNWVDACAANEIDQEDVVRFDHAGRTFAIYRSPDDEYFATDGLCTHEKIHLADGLVMDDTIECPKHNGRFSYKTGEARGAPVCINLKTYPVKVEGDRIMIGIGA
jgi:3-phenylpropionate/trans-cinnamate dioxygenase ferredoxin subunit